MYIETHIYIYMKESYPDALNVKLKNIYTDPSNWEFSAHTSMRRNRYIYLPFFFVASAAPQPS